MTWDETANQNEARDNRLVAEFHDTGVGIDADMLEKIFEPFEQGSIELRREAAASAWGCRSAGRLSRHTAAA